MSIVYIITYSQTFLSFVKSLGLYGRFQFFTENCFTHIIAFNPRTHLNPFSFNGLRCVHYFTLAFDL